MQFPYCPGQCQSEVSGTSCAHPILSKSRLRDIKYDYKGYIKLGKKNWIRLVGLKHERGYGCSCRLVHNQNSEQMQGLVVLFLSIVILGRPSMPLVKSS